ncbi:MAG: cadmium-translocating P-type ATPase [Sphaerochaetaceae bacterium]|nr:cadmium-translocating P-type ATPase [Sphaerochaetaceae bacterium]
MSVDKKELKMGQDECSSCCCDSCAADRFQNQASNFEKAMESEDRPKSTLKNILTVKNRLIVSGILFVAGIVSSHMGQLLTSNIILYVAYAIIGYSVVFSAFKNLFTGHLLDEEFLMTIASLGAFGVGQTSEGVAVMLFYMVGEAFNDYAMDKSKSSIKKLMELKPDVAHIIRNNSTIDVNPEKVEINDIILIKSGERIPLDSIIIEGTSTLDTSALTGESLPEDVSVDSLILSGSVNGSGTIKAKVIKSFSESTFSRILEMVENAGNRKAKSEVFIKKFSHYYTPIVVIAAVLTTLIPTLIFRQSFDVWFYRSLMFLVVSCPCALVLSVPLAFFGGIGAAAKSGVLLKGGAFIEKLAKVDTFVFDKTGTLTEGKFKVTEIKTYDFDENEALRYAALAEGSSTHPIARSIVDEYLSRNKMTAINNLHLDIKEIFGKGIQTTIEDKIVLVGSSDFLSANGVEIKDRKEAISTLVQIAVSGINVATIYVGDTVKSDSKESLRELKKEGVKNLVMLSGDRKKIADSIGKEIGIDDVKSQLLPEEKVVNLEKIMNDSKITAFVGDGINDAPSIARADIGIAMGALGSDAAIEASDVVIMGEDLSGLPKLVKLSKKTLRIAKQNIVFAIGVKVIIMILAVAGIGTMWMAVFGDVGVSILAVLNALRMLIVKKN